MCHIRIWCLYFLSVASLYCPSSWLSVPPSHWSLTPQSCLWLADGLSSSCLDPWRRQEPVPAYRICQRWLDWSVPMWLSLLHTSPILSQDSDFNVRIDNFFSRFKSGCHDVIRLLWELISESPARLHAIQANGGLSKLGSQSSIYKRGLENTGQDIRPDNLFSLYDVNGEDPG